MGGIGESRISVRDVQPVSLTSSLEETTTPTFEAFIKSTS